MVRLAVSGITGFSDRPLVLPLFVGAFTGIVALLTLIIAAFCSISMTVPGWLWCFALLLGVQALVLMFMGIQGAYLGKIFEESKNRPLYIVADCLNVKEHDNN